MRKSWLERRKSYNFIINRDPKLTFDKLLSLLLVVGIVLVCFRMLHITFPGSINELGQKYQLDQTAFFTALFGTDTKQSATILEILTFLFTAYMSKQILLQKRTADMDISHTIYQENTKKRKNKSIKTACELINKEMTMYMRNNDLEKVINDYYNSNKMDDLKELVFHYEYLGFLVYYQKINFHLLFDTISFPDLILEEALRKYNQYSFIDILRVERPDNWIGIEYLYHCYRLMRAYDEEWRNPSTKKYCLTQEKKEWMRCWDQIPHYNATKLSMERKRNRQ